MVGAGKRDRLVEILQQTVTGQDDLGQDIVSWTVWQSAWMGKREITAIERFRASQEIASETVIWQAPWLDGLSSSHRLRHNAKTYDVEGVAEIGRRHEMEITAVAVRV